MGLIAGEIRKSGKNCIIGSKNGCWPQKERELTKRGVKNAGIRKIKISMDEADTGGCSRGWRLCGRRTVMCRQKQREERVNALLSPIPL